MFLPAVYSQCVCGIREHTPSECNMAAHTRTLVWQPVTFVCMNNVIVENVKTSSRFTAELFMNSKKRNSQ